MRRLLCGFAVGLIFLALAGVEVAQAAKDVEAVNAAKRAGNTPSGAGGPVTTAAIELVCSDGTKLSISTGNDSGVCHSTQQGTGIACGPSGGNPTVNAVCGAGCTSVSSGATCNRFPKGTY